MLLGEAKYKLEQLEKRLLELDLLIVACDAKEVSKHLEEFNQLINKLFQLKERISSTERSTLFQGRSLESGMIILSTLQKKCGILEKLKTRSDVENNQVVSILEQLNSFRETKRILESALSVCLWSTELNE